MPSKRRGAFGLAACLMGAMLHIAPAKAAGTKVAFNEEGIALVNGQPFFPIGVFTYELNSDVLAELHELQCNTILNGFSANQLDLIQEHGLMAVCGVGREWVQAAQARPALLAW